jgi:hypothetical protein
MLTQEFAGTDRPRGSERDRHAGIEMTAKRSLGRAAGWCVLAVLSVGPLLWVAPLDDVLGELDGVDPLWLIAVAGLELASCASYVLLFRRLFEPVPHRSHARMAWIGLGAGAVLPGGDVAAITTSSVLLHRHGAPKRWLVVRSSVLLLLINGVGVAATGVAGALLLSGVTAGPHDLLRAGLPVLVSLAILGAVAAIPLTVRRFGGRSPVWIVALADAIGEAGRSLRRPGWRLLGAVGYPLLDMAALWAACAATGRAPSLVGLIVAYNIGYLASVVPIPAGIGVLDGGLAAALILYGEPASAAVAAVLVYHTLAVWIPALCGIAASVQLRRERHPHVAPAVVASRAARLPGVTPLVSGPA